MSTATATAEEPITVADPIRFVSQRSNLIVWHHDYPAYRQQNTLGTGVEVPGKFVEFVDGRLDVGEPLAQRLGLPLDEILAWLRGHDGFGDNEAGFFELQPEAPAPDEEIGAILRATANLDAEAVAALLAAEEAGHKRPVVVTACASALEQIEKMQAALAAEETKASS